MLYGAGARVTYLWPDSRPHRLRLGRSSSLPQTRASSLVARSPKAKTSIRTRSGSTPWTGLHSTRHSCGTSHAVADSEYEGIRADILRIFIEAFAARTKAELA